MTYRNPAFLSLAKKLPSCMGCDRPNVGKVVAAHSNRLEHGKGMGIKATDALWAGLCDRCHFQVDQGKWPYERRVELWEQAQMRTVRYLIESGHLLVSLVPTPAPVIEAKPKAKIAKRKTAWPTRPLESAREIPARKDPWPKGRKFSTRSPRSA